jgi:hypothetical protein
MAEKSLLSKLENIRPQFIFWGLFILILLPFLFPLNTPITISRYTTAFATQLRAVPNGGNVLLSLDTGIGAITETGGAIVVTAKFFANERPDVHLVIWGIHYDSILVYRTYVEPYLKALKYGTQYAWLGYIPGGEAAIAKLSDDIEGILASDFYGTAISSIPLMKDVKNAKSFDLVVTSDTYGYITAYIGHWFQRYNTKILHDCTMGSAPTDIAYFTANQIVGFSPGARGSAELEKLLKFPGFAGSVVDALNVGIVYLVGLLIIGNIGYFARRKGK